ncbi:MAG: rhomboid family intramembrane serine protease [Streptosporangiales bacterium]|nr:rhomboid family intramembrane serine protease [Streptosporangiales bacterium]
MVIPVHDDNPTRRVPIFTYLLVAINVAVFLASPLGNLTDSYGRGAARECATINFLREYAAIPKEMLTGEELPERRVIVDRQGDRHRCPAEDVNKLPWLSVLTAMFLHGGWAHLLGNMLFLYVFGNNVEDRIGRLRFLLFYLGTGYAAAYGHALTQPASTTPLVGASGAIAGVLGAYLVFYPRARVTSLVPFLLFFPFRLPAWVVLGFWFVLQWLYFRGTGVSEGAGVAYAAHVFGFLAGAAYAVVDRSVRGSRPSPAGYRWR